MNGIVGSYQGPGVKAVIPARATAKLNFRLVPKQDPDEIVQLFRQYIKQIVPSTMSAKIRKFASARPALVDRNHPALRAAATAYAKGFGSKPVFLRSGGTIPVVNKFQKILRVPTILMGLALPDDRMHAQRKVSLTQPL